MPRTRYPILQEFISDFGHKFTQKLRALWSPRLVSLKSVNDKWRELCSEMWPEPPKLTTQDGAIGISWSILEVVKFIQRHKVLHSAWDTSMPLTLIVRGDAFPVAGTQWSQLCITFANWGQLARKLSHQFIIGVAYCDAKDATILANLWETNIKVCVLMRPSWLFTSDCSIDELKFQLVQLNITTYNAPSSLSSCCKLSLMVQHLYGSGRRSIAKSGSGVTSRGCGDGWDYRNIARSLVYIHLPFGKGPNISSSPMPFGVPMPRRPHTALAALQPQEVPKKGDKKAMGAPKKPKRKDAPKKATPRPAVEPKDEIVESTSTSEDRVEQKVCTSFVRFVDKLSLAYVVLHAGECIFPLLLSVGVAFSL